MKTLFRLILLTVALAGVASAQSSLSVSGIQAGKGSVKPGEEVTFTITVENTGTAAYAGGSATFELSLSSNDASTISLGSFSAVSIPAIGASGSESAKITTTIPSGSSQAAQYFINVKMSGLGQASPVTATGTATITGNAVTSVTVTNGGSGYSGAPTATLSSEVGDVVTTAAALNPSVTNGSVSSIAITTSGAGYVNGTRAVTLSAPVVAATSINIGSYKTDSESLTIVGKPDLQLTTLTYATGTFAPLSVIPMTISYTNRSISDREPNVPFVPKQNGNGTYFRIQVVLSTNPVFGDADDFELTRFDIDQIENANDAIRTLSWNQLLPQNFAGTYFVLSKIDVLEKVDEMIEDDLELVGQNILSDLTGAKVTITPANSPTIYVYSTSSSGVVGDASSQRPSLSFDGRYAAFYSSATNLVDNDTNNVSDVFVKDTENGFVTRVSKSTNGVAGNGLSLNPAISGNGRYVVFQSEATNLVSGDSNNFADIFVYDTLLDTTTRLNVGAGNVQANNASASPSVSSDGRYVVFESSATNLVGTTAIGRNHVYVRDTQTGTLARVDQSTSGGEPNGASEKARISPDGSVITFVSSASNLVAGDTNGQPDVFVVERSTGATSRVSVAGDGSQANGASLDPAVNENGRYVVFSSVATNLVAGDTNGTSDVFVRDRMANTTLRLSVSAAGTQVSDPAAENNKIGSVTPSISNDGRYVAYASLAENILAGDDVGQVDGRDGNGAMDIYVLDRDGNADGVFDEAGDYVVSRASVNRFGYQTQRVLGEQSSPASLQPSISGDGRFVAMSGDAKGASGLAHNATNLISPDTNDGRDVFIYDRKTDTLPQPGFNQPPSITITTPSDGGSVTVNKAVTITASASDSDGSVASVVFFVDDAPLGAALTSPPFTVTWTPTATGSYTLTAVATDNKGNTGNAPDVAVTVTQVETTSPSATVYRGTYIGASDSGQFSFVVGRDGTGTLLTYSTQTPGKVFQQSGIPIAADGTFVVLDSAGGTVLSGNVATTGVSGSFSGGTFIGPVSIASSTGQFTAAMFTGSLTNIAGSSATAVVGGDGSIFMVASDGSVTDAASGLIGSTGAFTLTSPLGHRFAGNYTASTSTVGGVVTGPGLNAGFVLGQAKGRLLNLSTRAVAGAGDSVLIAGFRVFGTGSRELLIRGIGPSLRNFGVSGVIANPTLSLYNSAGAVVSSNDNWAASTELTAATSKVGAFALVPGSADAVLLPTLSPGNYTAVIGGGAGTGLIEIYDAGDKADASVMVSNLSTRGQVGTGEKIMITGFVVGGDQPRKFLIRAVGPTLGTFDASLGSIALADPTIKLYSGSNVLKENDNWGTGESAATVATYTPQVGGFALPAGSKDAAIAVTLSPGNYTVQVSGVGATTGVVLVEIYDVSAVQ